MKRKKKSIVANTTFKLPLFLLLDQVVTVHEKNHADVSPSKLNYSI